MEAKNQRKTLQVISEHEVKVTSKSKVISFRPLLPTGQTAKFRSRHVKYSSYHPDVAGSSLRHRLSKCPKSTSDAGKSLN